MRLQIRYLTFGFLGASLYMLPARKLPRTVTSYVYLLLHHSHTDKLLQTFVQT